MVKKMIQKEKLVEVKRKLNYEVYIAAILITIFFFVAGLAIGDYFAYQRVDDIGVYQKAISAFLTLSELKGELQANQSADYCNLSWDDVWKEKVEIGRLLTALELKLGKEDPAILEQKRIYNEVQFRTYKLVEKINENCDKKWDIILFFYTNKKSNTGGDYGLSELQGYVLDTVYERDKEGVKIFSFDINLLDKSTSELANSYNITTAPAMVINSKAYLKFMNENEIQRIFEK